MSEFIEIIFDGPPETNSGRFVEVEDGNGKSINFGEWIEHDDGLWALKFPNQEAAIKALQAEIKALKAKAKQLKDDWSINSQGNKL